MTKEEAIRNLEMIRIAFVDPVTKEQRKLINDTVDMAISALSENKGEWIPVIERLPKDGELVLCSVADSNHSVIINCFENQSYWRNGKIYAWQPLPEPYKGGEV